MNNNNFNTENFFGLQNIEALLSSSQARALAKNFAKEFSAALESAIIQEKPFEEGLNAYSKELTKLKDKMKDTFENVNFDSNIKKAINDTLTKADKQLNSLKQRFTDVYTAIEKENQKSDKDLNKMTQLLQQLYSIQTEYNIAQATTVENVGILVQENELRIEQSKVIAANEAYHRQEADLLLQKKMLINATDEKEIAALEKKIKLMETELSLAKNKLDTQKDTVTNTENDINQRRHDVSEIKANFNSENDANNKVFSDAKDTLKDLDKETTSTFKKWSSGIETIVSEITKIFDLYDQWFNNTEQRISNLNQEFGERWQIRNNISKNIGGADFNDYQTNIYNSATSGAMKGMYNEQELKEHLVSMSEYLFETKEAAVENSQLIAYGNKFLGMSSESMKSIYNLEKMTNGDGFIRSQLQTITKLQNSGLITSQAQLDKLTTLAANTTRELSELGLKGDAAQTLQSSMTEVSAVLDSKVYDGAGQDFQNKIVEALKDPTGAGVELFGSNITRAQQIVNSGAPDVAWQLYDLIQGSPYAAKTRELSTNGYSISSAIAGQQFSNAGFYNAIGNNASQIEQDRKMLASMGLEDYLAKSQENDSKQVDERTKWLNEKAVDLANGQYDVLVEQAMSSERIETLVDEINRNLKILTTGLGVMAGLESGAKFLGKLGGKGGGSGLSLFSKGGGAAGGGKLAGLTIGKASGLTAAAGVASIAAGTLWAGYDGITGGMNGLTDEDGNYIMDKGVKTGFVTAFGGKDINTDSYQGKLTKSAKKENTWDSVGSGAAKGALIGAGIGTFFGPGIGTAIGAGIGGLVGGLAGLWSGSQKNKEAEEYAKKQYEEQKRLTEINQEMLDIAKRGNAALAYRYAIDTSVMGGMGSVSSEPSTFIPTTGRGGKDYPWSVTSSFHDGRTLSNGDNSAHNGIDFGIGLGTPIGAPIGGTVLSYQVDPKNTYPNGSKSGGTWLYVLGDDGVTYGFGHLSSISSGLTKKGAKVSYGQTIGLSGNTGYSTGPHLHFSTKVNGGYVNPESYITQGLFSPSGGSYSSDSSSYASDLLDTSSLNASATMRTASRTHYVAGAGNINSPAEQQSIDITPIVAGLEAVNNTIKELGERQDAQQRILDALTVKPIPSLGI